MKLRNHQFSTQPRIFEGSEYVHPWYQYENIYRNIGMSLVKKPNPPTKEAIERAKFVDKTYHWSRNSDTRPRKQRVTK